ncbi:DNA topoisomerase III, partial [Bacillus pseudomycoides]|nr:DNA topoisomerase III [Bacillus pseudomycoides]
YHSVWKKWSLDTLPMIPERFQLEVTKSMYKQYNAVKQLLHNPQVTGIIHAGDAGRDGEVIVRNINNLCNVQKPMK